MIISYWNENKFSIFLYVTKKKKKDTTITQVTVRKFFNIIYEI